MTRAAACYASHCGQGPSALRAEPAELRGKPPAHRQRLPAGDSNLLSRIAQNPPGCWQQPRLRAAPASLPHLSSLHAADEWLRTIYLFLMVCWDRTSARRRCLPAITKKRCRRRWTRRQNVSFWSVLAYATQFIPSSAFRFRWTRGLLHMVCGTSGFSPSLSPFGCCRAYWHRAGCWFGSPRFSVCSCAHARIACYSPRLRLPRYSSPYSPARG